MIQKINDKVVLRKLKKLAEEFDMNFDISIFKKNIVSEQDCLLLQFISGAPVNGFDKFGTALKQRAKNIDRFLASDMSVYYNKGDGLVVNIAEAFGVIKNIENPKTKKRLTILLNGFKAYCGEAVVLGKPGKTSEREKMNSVRVLYHEWIHVLVDYNKLTFKNWKYNEAFTIYLEHYLKTMDNRDLESLKKEVEEETSNMEHKKRYDIVTIYMGRFIKLFSDKRTPEDRMATLREFWQKKNE